MMDAGNDVTLVFNFGASSGYQGGVATHGIQANEDALWPAVNSFVSFTAVSVREPGTGTLLGLGSVALLGVAGIRGLGRRRRLATWARVAALSARNVGRAAELQEQSAPQS